MHCDAVRGGGAEREPWRTLLRISIFHSDTHNQTGPHWCWFPSGWACARPRPLWVSPMTTPVRLGVSPAAALNPTGVFNQRFEALFPCAGALGYAVCFAPHRLSGLSVCECGAAGATRRSACPVLRHSESGPLGLSVCECGAAGSARGQTACPICPTLLQSQSPLSNESPGLSDPAARLRPSYQSG